MTELFYSIASNVIDKIGTHAFQEIFSAWGISEDMKKLERTMAIIEAVLVDAEEKQVNDGGLSVWLGQLKDVFQDATDVLDEFECEALRRHVVKTYGNTSNQVLASISSFPFNPLGFSYKMSHKVKGIRESWEELAKCRGLLNLEERSEDQNIDHRENFLRGGGHGSEILVTTRSHKVVSTMVPVSDDDCLTLFLRCAFKEEEHKQYPKLVEIGQQIVKKCKGVPLAVKTLGSLLYSKIEESDWISIRDDKIWKLKQKENDILPALRLSYNKLPSYLKQCFAYCSLYPKNFRYDNKYLIQCWMADGLLKKSNEKEMEDIGEQYIKELLSRSFFQVVEYDTIYWSFKMDDLLHDLSLHVAQNDYCLIEDIKNTNKFEKARHVSILDHKLGVDATITFLNKLSNNMRTINFSVDYDQVDSIDINESLVKTCISRFKHLRSLNLRHSTLETLSSSIGTLKHLRCLNLSENKKIKKLPDSICDLQNLETLILLGCVSLEELPRDIRKMVSLRYFEITTKQTRLPANGIECLYSLRQVHFFKCYRLMCFHEGIQRLTALRSLSFESCESLTSLPQGMKHLTALESLVIDDCEELNFMEGDEYPTRLRQLLIFELSQLVSLPQWLKESASTLQFIEIVNCENLEELPEWLPDLSSLCKLRIECCPISSLPEGMDCLTALRELKIVDCPELRRDYEREVFASFRSKIDANYRRYQKERIASLP